MKRLIKSFPFKMDEISDSGEFSGYASIFGNVDLGGDIIERGAFKKTLRESKGVIPILDHHDPSRQIGWNIKAKEDERGLLIHGQLDLNVESAKERHSLMKMAVEVGGRTGLSVGYRTIKWENDPKDRNVRILKELQLFEYSVVTFPMNPQAAVTGVKMQSDLIRQFLKIEIGMSGDQVEKAVEFLEKIKTPEPDPHSESKKREPLMHSIKDLLRTIQN
jgi:Escherichia/Staphylococcus phage prohead protease